MNFLKKIQKQPKHVRKFILWAIIVIIGITLLIFWIWISSLNIKRFSKEEFIKESHLRFLEKEINKIPKIKVPSAQEEKIKKEKKE